MNDRRDLDLLLRAQDGDPGCDVTVETLAAYVDLELGGEDPARAYLFTAIHLECCPACRTDHDGLLEAARRFGHVTPE
jgi:predicted anti-sigma-YlaC factor YlaD